MNKCFKKFQVKDFVFLAILSAAMTLCGGITMPLVMHTTLFGLRNMAAAPIYALFCAIGMMKVRKPGVQPGFLTSLIFRSVFRRSARVLFARHVLQQFCGGYHRGIADAPVLQRL